MNKLVKSIILGALLLVVFSFGNSAFARGHGVVADDESLNVRTGPGTEYSVKASLPFGTIVIITDEKDGWEYVDHALYYSEIETIYTKNVGGWCAANRIADYSFYDGWKGTINAPDTNIRRGPGSSSQVVAVAQPGDTVMLLGHTPLGWTCIKYFGVPGTYWVYDEYVS